MTRPIQEIRVGQRVLAENPELAAQYIPQPDFDPETTRLVVLHQIKPDGHELTVETLVPLEALLEKAIERLADEIPATIRPLPLVGTAENVFLHELLLGAAFDLTMPELGADGPATIRAVLPCPPLEPDDGTGRRLVTSVFRHEAANVIDLYTTGSDEPIGVTTNHPFWSEDRQEFVPAGELRVGEHLRRADGGLARVANAVRRITAEPVFNFEVDGQHAYFVNSSGILVHNGCLVTATMRTLDLTQTEWRQTAFAKRGLVYILRDARTGELLKVGNSKSSRFLGRFEKYVAAQNRTLRDLALDVFEVDPGKRTRIEIEIRKTLGAMYRLPWDNTGGRLGRPGPGIPF